MQIISYNVNGIRAAIKKGLIEWLETAAVDVLCVQETKASAEDIDISIFTSLGYHIAWYPAQKKGYSGVAIFSKKKPFNAYPCLIYTVKIPSYNNLGVLLSFCSSRFKLLKLMPRYSANSFLLNSKDCSLSRCNILLSEFSIVFNC